jgi:hypothetical protein
MHDDKVGLTSRKMNHIITLYGFSDGIAIDFLKKHSFEDDLGRKRAYESSTYSKVTTVCVFGVCSAFKYG